MHSQTLVFVFFHNREHITEYQKRIFQAFHMRKPMKQKLKKKNLNNPQSAATLIK